MGNYFITGTGTEVGKTVVVSDLCSHLVQEKRSVFALKPLVSGWCDDDNDVVRILKALSLPITQSNIELISFARLKLPLAPNLAAEKEGVMIEFDDVVDFCSTSLQNKCEFCFVEGAGGVMSPLTNNTTYKDLIEVLNIPVILVTTIYLGVISHVLTALEALRDSRIECVVMNTYNIQDGLNPIEIKREIERFTDVRVVIYGAEAILSKLL